MWKAILTLSLLWSASASAGLVKNKCWNTDLSVDGERACAICEPLVEEKFRVACAAEVAAVDNCFADFDTCGEDYREILDAKYNCKTELVNACFLEQIAH